jgi:hypothetical protein
MSTPELFSYCKRGDTSKKASRVRLGRIRESLLTFESQQQSMQGRQSSFCCLDSMDIEGDDRFTCTVAIPEIHDTVSSSPENVFVVFNRAFTHHEEHGVSNSSTDYTTATATLLGCKNRSLRVGMQSAAAYLRNFCYLHTRSKSTSSKNWVC